VLKIKELSDLLNEQLNIYSKLLELESEKTGILLKGDVEALDNIVTRQQPYIMNSANFEKQREELHNDMGLSGLTLRQIIDNYPEAKSLENVFSELNSVVTKLRKTCDKNKTILNSKLNVVKYILSKSGASDDGMITYSNIKKC
jgi:flagellar biosynthesis/type III secretory pathway chaperone